MCKRSAPASCTSVISVANLRKSADRIEGAINTAMLSSNGCYFQRVVLPKQSFRGDRCLQNSFQGFAGSVHVCHVIFDLLRLQFIDDLYNRFSDQVRHEKKSLLSATQEEGHAPLV